MCGIVGLHLRNPELYPRLGELLTGMLCEMSNRGSDSAGVAVYGDPDVDTAGPRLRLAARAHASSRGHSRATRNPSARQSVPSSATPVDVDRSSATPTC